MYCPHPFTRLEIKADGGVYCCCEGWLSKPLGNILERDLVEIWNGHDAEEIRASILDGSFRYCRACPYLPGPGGPVTVESPALPTSERIRVLKLDYDQSCNLTCPSCRVTHSRNFVDATKVAKIHDAMLRSRILDITDQLYVTGAGDPFASALYWDFLCRLSEVAPSSLAQNPSLQIFLHTNGLLCDQIHWDLLGDTRKRITEIGISVDAGTASTYTENRQGSWTKLWDNVAFVNHLQQTSSQINGQPITLGMFYTVQDNNFRELIPFTRLAFNHNINWISVTALRNWGTYTKEEYLSKAVHLPDHPNYAEFQSVIRSPRLTQDKRIILDRFNPDYTAQEGKLIPLKGKQR